MATLATEHGINDSRIGQIVTRVATQLRRIRAIHNLLQDDTATRWRENLRKEKSLKADLDRWQNSIDPIFLVELKNHGRITSLAEILIEEPDQLFKNWESDPGHLARILIQIFEGLGVTYVAKEVKKKEELVTQKLLNIDAIGNSQQIERLGKVLGIETMQPLGYETLNEMAKRIISMYIERILTYIKENIDPQIRLSTDYTENK